MYEIKIKMNKCLRLGLIGAALFWPVNAIAEQQLILDLIQAENARLAQPKTEPSVRPATKEVVVYEGPDLVLKAMYGVDTRILAEVSFRGETYLYLRGQVWPLGDQQGRSQLRLISMSARCIQVAHKEEHFDACVLPHGGQH